MKLIFLGLEQNVLIEDLTSSGYDCLYDMPYSDVTSLDCEYFLIFLSIKD